MTTRQAVLASIIGSFHISFGAVSDLPVGFRSSILTVGSAKKMKHHAGIAAERGLKSCSDGKRLRAYGSTSPRRS